MKVLKEHPASKNARFLDGPRQGVAANFLNTLAFVPANSFAAFCDQDDVWRHDKLSRAVCALSRSKGPAVYTADRTIANADLSKRRRQSRRSASFAKLLFRNRCAGHTSVFNAQSVMRLQAILPPSTVPFHDWWATLAVTGMGGQYIHDPEPVLIYRQHDKNLLGAYGGRLRMMLDGTYRRWFWANVSALFASRDSLNPEARKIIEALIALQGKSQLVRFPSMAQATRAGPGSLAMAALSRL